MFKYEVYKIYAATSWSGEEFAVRSFLLKRGKINEPFYWILNIELVHILGGNSEHVAHARRKTGLYRIMNFGLLLLSI